MIEKSPCFTVSENPTGAPIATLTRLLSKTSIEGKNYEKTNWEKKQNKRSYDLKLA